MKCSVALVNISNYLTVLLRSSIHRQTKYMKLTNVCFCFTVDITSMLLPLQIGFHFVAATVACSILETNSGFKPWCETTVPRFLPSLSLFSLIFLWVPLALDKIQWAINLCWAGVFCSQMLSLHSWYQISRCLVIIKTAVASGSAAPKPTPL